jgi:hypothetical protein
VEERAGERRLFSVDGSWRGQGKGFLIAPFL